MVKFCFKKPLGFIFVLSLSATGLLATPFGTEDKDARSIHSTRSIEDLPDELHLVIFSFLTLKDVPSVTRTSSRWQRLIDDNHLWEEYSRRAQILLTEDLVPGRNYKTLVREHCTFSFTDLGFLNGGTLSSAQGISADGLVIVGYADDGAMQDLRRAFRWTAEKGMESLGTLNGGKRSWATGISADGLVIVGCANDGAARDLTKVIRWTVEKGMESLEPLCNKAKCSPARVVNSDGSVMVGYEDARAAKNQETVFRWTAEKGRESVEKMIIDKGLLPAQWRLTKVNAITPSGTVLIGEGTYNDGNPKPLTRAWRAVIPRANLF